ncbi:MAG TPA: TVP38/TMEM64 family protein [Gemmataceae bacterium]|jgi:uncharacterized membrane protein YdjX (TVP38/TMEM64 family)|nr:TVP38/TMEM64 family protein [Gemmataceae bacterium]
MHPRKLTTWLKLALLVAFLAAAVYYLRFTELGREVTPAFVLGSIERHGPVTARLIYVAVYIVGTVALLPGTVLSFAGAVLFGPYEGTLYTWVGATIGATLAYLMARVLGRDFVERLFGGRFAAFDQRIREHGFTGLLLIRLLPLFPFNAVNFGCGLTGIRLRDYVLATAIGIVPGTFVYQFLFAKFGRRILTEGLHLEYLADPQLGLAIGLFAAFVIVGKWLSNKVSRKSTAVAKAPTEAA